VIQLMWKIQFMHNRVKVIFTLVVLGLMLSTEGQASNPSNKKDTLFVYETLVIYDTLFVHDTIRIPNCNKMHSKRPEIQILYLENIAGGAQLITLPFNGTATLERNGIILNENNKNLKGMKKLSFLGVVLFAFQSMVVAQTDFGFTAGGGTWWAKCNQSSVNSHYSPTLHAGLFFECPLPSAFFLKSELNYHFLMSNGSYKFADPDVYFKSPSATGGSVYSISFGDEWATNFHQISVPISVGYKIRKFKPYIGIEYSFRMSEAWFNKRIHSFGWNTGVIYPVSDRISAGLNFYKGLTTDCKDIGYKMNLQTLEIFSSNEYKWKSNRFEVSIYYSMIRNK
jgi:hypothetical protein